MLALAGFLVVIALAMLLLYRVYVHHTRTAPYVEDGPAIVRLDVKFSLLTS
jgi:hypothetical protein